MQVISAETILMNGHISTMDPAQPFVEALAIRDGKVLAIGDNKSVSVHQDSTTRVIDLKQRTVIPGLNDSHLHLIRGGLNYNMELRWDGVPSLTDALRMLKEQAARTPAPQWVRVVGGWSEFQFTERRIPTLDEINAVSPDTPVFILHLYDRALLNQAALRAIGYDKNTQELPGTEIQRDGQGNPTGMLIAKPNAIILYATLAQGPKLSPEDQINSTRHFMRELNRLGVTSCIDAGGGFQNYPEDYGIVQELNKRNQLTVRIAYNLFTQRPKAEKDDFVKWARLTRPGEGDDFFKVNGAGEMLVFSAADFEDFQQPRPDLVDSMDDELEAVVRVLATNRWPFRIHATYDESIHRMLTVFEKVNQDIPFDGLRWFFDHAETISDRNIDRVKALQGGIAIQHRMAFQGEHFKARYGQERLKRTPPIRQMLNSGLPVGAGTDATRVASYNSFVSLYWLVSGCTVGGMPMYDSDNILDRLSALRLYTEGSAWFSGDEQKKGALKPGYLADLAVLTDDYFSIPVEQIKSLESVLTMVNGTVVYAAQEFKSFDPPPLPVSPEWSPVKYYGGYAKIPVSAKIQDSHDHTVHHDHCRHTSLMDRLASALKAGLWVPNHVWDSGCLCSAF